MFNKLDIKIITDLNSALFVTGKAKGLAVNMVG